MSEHEHDRSEASYASAGALEAEETRYSGRYTPYSGGSAGWFENAGVPRSELGNNYRLYTALDTGHVLQKRFERLGAELSRRHSQRVPAAGVPVTVRIGDTEAEGTIRDFSEGGVRVRLPTEAELAVGTRVTLRVQPSSFFKTELAQLDAEVVWLSPIRGNGPGWHAGLAYRGL